PVAHLAVLAGDVQRSGEVLVQGDSAARRQAEGPLTLSVARDATGGMGCPQEGGRLLTADENLKPSVHDLVFASDPAQVKVSPLFEALLHSPNGLLKGGNPTAAVVSAQTAVEVCTERGLVRVACTPKKERGVRSRSGSVRLGSSRDRDLLGVPFALIRLPSG